MKISCRFFLRMSNVSDKNCRENHKTQFYVQCYEIDVANVEILGRNRLATDVGNIIRCIKN